MNIKQPEGSNKVLDSFVNHEVHSITHNTSEDGLRDLHKERFGEEIHGLCGEEEALALEEIHDED